MIKKITIILVVVFVCKLYAQTTFPTNGAPYNPHTVYAFINANLFVDYETNITNASLLVKDGKVIDAGKNINIPKHAIVYDLSGKYIYPSFIDLYSNYGIGEISSSKSINNNPQTISNYKGAYGWNQAIKSDIDASKLFQHNKDKAFELINNGIGLVLTSNKDGIVRGSGVLAMLNCNQNENESIVLDKAAAFYSFNKGSSSQNYPSSLTGAIALLRQTYYDAQWYKNLINKTEYNISLECFNQLQNLPAIFEANDKFNAIRANKVALEFNQKYIIKGGGNEYQRLEDIAQLNSTFILPLNFPEAYDVSDILDADNITLTDLKHWELAPSNPAFLEKQNINFCFTAYDLKDKKLFLPNVRKAIKNGLSEKMALKALTHNPATLINCSNKVGALKSNYIANFFISNKSVFEDDCEIIQHWINGQSYINKDLSPIEIAGKYELKFNSNLFKVTIQNNKAKSVVLIDTSKKLFNVNLKNNLIHFSFKIDSLKNYRAIGNYNKTNKSITGKIENEIGDSFDFNLNFVDTVTSDKPKAAVSKINPLDYKKITYPFNAFGIGTNEQGNANIYSQLKKRNNNVLFKNAIVWTNETDSILNGYDVYISDGKIVRIAKNIDVLPLANVKVIDATGKHLTPGIIDEHSHIALTWGVNEGTQASSAEVRMGDVINPDDINIYRQLAGGVTTSQLLHGSANPIGGQSVLIKLRWGLNADDMKFANADGFIKFALGENVKQSWIPDYANMRFPQTRMGVEQVYNDYFTRAKEYNKNWNNFNNSTEKNKIAPRKDIELDCVAEILNKKKFITCHSYVQSEINMLMHVADSFNFKVNTFTHILEGYKVADKMKKHNTNASTFADWWAYKNEVMDAIPYNAAILTNMGVITAINSDDAEMARRLNQEAAKTIKYGNISEVEALKMVTLNPAKMLHIDNEVGSIKVGKSGDLVLWNNNPLSVYAKPELTLIDGITYFDKTENQKLIEEVKLERARIIALLLDAKKSGAKTSKYSSKTQRNYHCNTLNGVSEEITGER
ncbi:MAG: amidohydrolase family protein [Bacteroidetes bacterium]|nr:amidohydrolase family protein [Bacteroidota bacterium]